MLKSFLVVYEQGYAAGLRRATAMPGERDAFQEAVDSAPDELLEASARPAYQEGFADGFRDGVQALTDHKLP